MFTATEWHQIVTDAPSYLLTLGIIVALLGLCLKRYRQSATARYEMMLRVLFFYIGLAASLSFIFLAVAVPLRQAPLNNELAFLHAMLLWTNLALAILAFSAIFASTGFRSAVTILVVCLFGGFGADAVYHLGIQNDWSLPMSMHLIPVYIILPLMLAFCQLRHKKHHRNVFYKT